MEPLFDPLPYGDPLEFGDMLAGDLGGSMGFLTGELFEGLIGEELVSLAFTPLITLPLIFLPLIVLASLWLSTSSLLEHPFLGSHFDHLLNVSQFTHHLEK